MPYDQRNESAECTINHPHPVRIVGCPKKRSSTFGQLHRAPYRELTPHRIKQSSGSVLPLKLSSRLSPRSAKAIPTIDLKQVKSTTSQFRDDTATNRQRDQYAQGYSITYVDELALCAL